MVHGALSTMIDLGWELLPIVRGALAEAGGTFCQTPSWADAGRRLIVLAEGLAACGQSTPARMLQNLAAVFVELAQPGSRLGGPVKELIQTALHHFGDLLVELDATGQATLAEPVELLNQLEATTARLRMDRLAQDRSFEAATADEVDSVLELRRCSESLVETSDSLLNRMQRDGDSPYMPTVSRIHFLAKTQRDLLANLHPRLAVATSLVETMPASGELPAAESPLADEGLPECGPSAFRAGEFRSGNGDDVAVSSPGRAPRVLIVDQSSFMRMLFRSAIESSGFATETAVNLDEAMRMARPDQPCGVVVWNADCNHCETVRLTEWLRCQTFATRPALIAVIDKGLTEGDFSPEYDWVVNRDDVAGLLNIISGALAGNVLPTRLSA